MKKHLLLPLLLILAFSYVSAQEFFDKSDAFFKKHVSSGKVNYANIKASPSELNDLVSTIGSYSLSGKSSNEKLAFYINAYNILMIKSVVDKYPIAKPTDVPGLFDQKKHKVAGMSLTLSDIENKKLRPAYKDARLHFVLVCGAVSCPKLASYAFTPANVKSRMTSRTKLAVNDRTFIKVDDANKTVKVSEIFLWYKEDFGNSISGALTFINKYRSEPIPSDYKVETYTYNWKLNKK